MWGERVKLFAESVFLESVVLICEWSSDVYLVGLLVLVLETWVLDLNFCLAVSYPMSCQGSVARMSARTVATGQTVLSINIDG